MSESLIRERLRTGTRDFEPVKHSIVSVSFPSEPMLTLQHDTSDSELPMLQVKALSHLLLLLQNKANWFVNK
jgi:hypothetical protein